MAYSIGDEILVRFTGTVQSSSPGPNSTVAVYEKDGIYVHYLYRGDTAIFPRGYPRNGDTVEINFTATIDGPEEGEQDSCTQVTCGGFTHDVFLGSKSVSLFILPSQNSAEDSSMAISSGDTVTVKFTGLVGADKSKSGTTKVTETIDGYTHYLYLGDTGIYSGGGDRPAEGARVEFSFTAEATGDYGDLFTRRVNRGGFTHYVFLGSQRVTKTETPEPEPEPVFVPTTGPYKSGDKIRVEFSGTVSRTEGNGPAGTARVEASNTTNHFLYLKDTSVFPDGPPGKGTAVAVAFTGEVYEDKASGDLATTRVISPNGNSHFLYLDGLQIKRIPVIGSAGTITAAGTTVTQAAGQAITATDDEITSTAVNDRVAELETKGTGLAFTVTRDRTRELLPGFGGKPLTFNTAARAIEYLDDLDFDPARFTVNTVPSLTADETAELNGLRNLAQAGRLIFGFDRWNTTKVLLRPDRYFSRDWARQQAGEKFGLRADQVIETTWPFAFTDWSEAARDLKENQYLRIYAFDEGKVFWGELATA